MAEENENRLIGYPDIIPYKSTKKIQEQMESCICKLTVEGSQGTGFFCKIPFPDLNNMLPVFITNNHIIDKEYLYKNNSKILLNIKKENEEICLNLNNRIKYTNEKYDITIIEIKEKDNVKNYMELDDIIINDIINNNNENKDYQDETVYIIQYPRGKLSVSYGIINKIYIDKKYSFQHKCITYKGSSGSPILNIDNKILGIHKKGYENYNLGTFLNFPIKELIQKNKGNNNIIMTNIIKNINILFNIFSKIGEKKKLNLIKFNKSLQNKLCINLINYKFMSGKYKIFENNEKGKEYDGFSGILLFEGEYLNGKRNGKGKEYNDVGKLVFEGEYLNGKKWKGKGKEYHDIGILLFEGEYLNGQRNGKGKEYDWNGVLRFEGEYLNGRRSGKGKEYNDNRRLIFEGEYLKGEKWNGKGKEYNYDRKLIFDGEYLNGQRNGKGKEYNNDGI